MHFGGIAYGGGTTGSPYGSQHSLLGKQSPYLHKVTIPMRGKTIPALLFFTLFSL